MIDFFDRLDKFMEYKGLNDNKITVEAGISNGLIGKGRKRGSLSQDSISKLLYTYKELDANWLLTGNGPMLKSDEKGRGSVGGAPDKEEYYKLSEDIAAIGVKPIPLVNQRVAAGFGSDDFCIEEADVKDYYVIPKFRNRHIDFMIEVSGSSMYPKYSSGDVIACAILKESAFIQWNKPHVIATREQGILVKRIKEGTNPNSLLAISDNKDYPPFEIPKDEITGIALIVGAIRLE